MSTREEKRERLSRVLYDQRGGSGKPFFRKGKTEKKIDELAKIFLDNETVMPESTLNIEKIKDDDDVALGVLIYLILWKDLRDSRLEGMTKDELQEAVLGKTKAFFKGIKRKKIKIKGDVVHNIVDKFYNSGVLIENNGKYRLHEMCAFSQKELTGLTIIDFSKKECSYNQLLDRIIFHVRDIYSLGEVENSRIEVFPESFFKDIDKLRLFCGKQFPFIDMMFRYLSGHSDIDSEIYNVGALTDQELIYLGKDYNLNKNEIEHVVSELKSHNKSLQHGCLVQQTLEEPRIVERRLCLSARTPKFHEAKEMYTSYYGGFERRNIVLGQLENGYKTDIENFINRREDPVAILFEEYFAYYNSNESKGGDSFKVSRRAEEMAEDAQIILDICCRIKELKKGNISFKVFGKDHKPKIRVMGRQSAESKDGTVYYFNDVEYENRKNMELSMYVEEAYKIIGKGIQRKNLGGAIGAVYPRLSENKLLHENGMVYLRQKVETDFRKLVSNVKKEIERIHRGINITDKEIIDTISAKWKYPKTSPPTVDEAVQEVREYIKTKARLKIGNGIEEYKFIRELGAAFYNHLLNSGDIILHKGIVYSTDYFDIIIKPGLREYQEEGHEEGHEEEKQEEGAGQEPPEDKPEPDTEEKKEMTIEEGILKILKTSWILTAEGNIGNLKSSRTQSDIKSTIDRTSIFWKMSKLKNNVAVDMGRLITDKDFWNALRAIKKKKLIKISGKKQTNMITTSDTFPGAVCKKFIDKKLLEAS